MMFKLVAINKVTGEMLEWFGYETEADAVSDMENVEWDEDDIPEDWRFEVVPYDEDEEPADIDNDCGFDPYAGCFTYDC